jgi:hypothetical protein
MFVETPNDSRRDADVADFCEMPHRDLTGITEAPAEAEAEVRPIVVRQPPDAPYALLARRDQRECALTPQPPRS